MTATDNPRSIRVIAVDDDVPITWPVAHLHEACPGFRIAPDLNGPADGIPLRLALRVGSPSYTAVFPPDAHEYR